MREMCCADRVWTDRAMAMADGATQGNKAKQGKTSQQARKRRESRRVCSMRNERDFSVCRVVGITSTHKRISVALR